MFRRNLPPDLIRGQNPFAALSSLNQSIAGMFCAKATIRFCGMRARRPALGRFTSAG
jgi:hypothetical protein